jgi:3-hydroxyisobutyrate dehydrogenase-like beta-hydroxyacid dehydrogenase
MNIAIIGYGKMGKMAEKAALEAGHAVIAIVDPLAPAVSVSGAPLYSGIAEAVETVKALHMDFFEETAAKE